MAASNITVAALAATPGIGHMALKWSFIDPNWNGLPYLSLDAVEVLAATSNDRSLATKVGEGRDTREISPDCLATGFHLARQPVSHALAST